MLSGGFSRLQPFQEISKFYITKKLISFRVQADYFQNTMYAKILSHTTAEDYLNMLG